MAITFTSNIIRFKRAQTAEQVKAVNEFSISAQFLIH